MSSKEEKLNKIGLREKSILMFLMILLPLGLYAAMQMGASFLAWIVAGLFVLSMAVMVWLG